VCYEQGSGVTKDEKKAVEWYEKAAAQNDADAQQALGTWLVREESGVRSRRTECAVQHVAVVSRFCFLESCRD
jgi:TPR repeat protein